MSTLIILLLCGAAGGFIFEWFGLPGGAMTGAIIAVILLKSFSSLPQAAFPRPFQFCLYAGLGFLILDAWGRGDQLEMFTGILAMSLLGVALYELCNVLETRSCRWRNFHMAGKR